LICAKGLCKVRICANKELALCLDLFWEGGYGAQGADLLSSTDFGSMALCTGEDGCKILKKTNKEEEEEVGGCSPTLG
jgi:hypothetical protein